MSAGNDKNSNLLASCKEYLEEHRQALRAKATLGSAGRDAVREYARALDGMIETVFAIEAAKLDALDKVTLVAVGGYGRRELGLASDLDLLFLVDEDAREVGGKLAEAVLYPLWDIGLDVGHMVRTIDESLSLARDDLRTATTLADLRYLCGAKGVVERLFSRARSEVVTARSADLIGEMLSRMSERHRRFGSTVYLLEPELKQGRGGMRDGDVMRWAIWFRSGISESRWLERGSLLRSEIALFDEARDFQWKVRNLLHAKLGRRQDRLTFADQEEIAETLGYQDGVLLGVERFMHDHYRFARQIAHLSHQTLTKLVEGRPSSRQTFRLIDNGCGVFAKRMTFVRSAIIEERPHASLQIYVHALTENRALYPLAVEALRRACQDTHWRQALRADADASRLLVRLLTDARMWPGRDSTALESIHDVGLLAAMIPEFDALIGRVRRDAFHVYTTDMHALRAAAQILRWKRGEIRPELALVSRLLAETPNLLALVFATLMHSISGASKNGSERAARVAEKSAQRLGFDLSDAIEVRWLVRSQSLLYDALTKRDMHSRENIAEVQSKVGARSRLRMLWLMTVAIHENLRPEGMSSWTAHVLSDGYRLLAREFRGSSRTDQHIALKSELLDVFGMNDGAGLRLVEALPERYLLANEAESIRFHLQMLDAWRRQPELGFRVIQGPSDDSFAVVFVDRNRDGLLAKLAVGLAHAGLWVLDAQIFTIEAGSVFDIDEDLALDIFVCALPAWACGHGASMADNFVEVHERIERGLANPNRFLWRPNGKYLQHDDWREQIRIHFDTVSSSDFTIVDLSAPDAPGVLSVVTQTMLDEGWDVAQAKLNSEGNRVVDVFYIRDRLMEDSTDGRRHAELHEALLSSLFAHYTAHAAE